MSDACITESKVSPMMAQWHACKNRSKDALLLFRLGDFYEAFHEDAFVLAKELNLTLTKRQEVPMSGIPFHASEGYIDKLVSRGFKIAIAEQIEDPRLAKGLVRREIVRIVTPGTLVQSGLLQEKQNHFIVSLTRLNSLFGLAFLDLSTGEMKVLELEEEREVFDELFRLQPRECIVSEKCLAHHKEAIEKFAAATNCLCQSKEEWCYSHRTAYETLIRHFRVHSLDGFGLKGLTVAVNAAGALLYYVHDELNLSIDHVADIRVDSLGRYMSIDRTTQRHLEITEALHDPTNAYTLLSVLDHTRTPMGGRLLRHWLLHPLLDVSTICERQEAIASLMMPLGTISSITHSLEQIRDLERLIMRISSGYSNPRDLFSLRLSLEAIPNLSQALKAHPAPLLQAALAKLKDVSEIVSAIAAVLSDDPPIRLSDGGVIRPGVNPELDELKNLHHSNTDWLIAYQTRLRELTGIKTLKVSFTKAFGYYIEVSRGQAEKMPSTFTRRQTLVNGERFISAELKEYEHRILTAEEKIATLESELFQKLREKILTYAPDIRIIAKAVAEIDCLLSLAEVALRRRYVRPVVDQSTIFQIEKGRHPVIEISLPEGHFVPNDTLLDDSRRLILITGPNMAGKSTYIRQNALLAIMAQTGSFVPAERAHIGIIDKVFSRIGASDDLARGQSTFMVEMSETANILHNATPCSLIVLDEIGRGTSTYDGIAIAWAVAEFLLTHDNKRAKTLFATHYSELNVMEGLIPGAVTCNVAVHESDQGIAFLHKILPGGTNRSYGIHVAKLAGLPFLAIKKAEEMLAKMEKMPNSSPPSSSSRNKPKQLDLFTATAPEEVLVESIACELRKLEPESITPLEALVLIAQWKKRLLAVQ